MVDPYACPRRVRRGQFDGRHDVECDLVPAQHLGGLGLAEWHPEREVRVCGAVGGSAVHSGLGRVEGKGLPEARRLIMIRGAQRDTGRRGGIRAFGGHGRRCRECPSDQDCEWRDTTLVGHGPVPSGLRVAYGLEGHSSDPPGVSSRCYVRPTKCWMSCVRLCARQADQVRRARRTSQCAARPEANALATSRITLREQGHSRGCRAPRSRGRTAGCLSVRGGAAQPAWLGCPVHSIACSAGRESPSCRADARCQSGATPGSNCSPSAALDTRDSGRRR